LEKALIVYWSQTGNTEKVAQAIKKGLESADVTVTIKKADVGMEVDYFDYDLVCVGSPSIQWHPAKPLDDFLKKKLAAYRSQGKIKPCAPKIPGKNALIFVTYSGPHTGLDEATPVAKYVGQFFQHIGFTIMGEWYILSEFHGSEENSTKGLMGEIRGKPTAEDLKKISENARQLGSNF
jgi:flavodoxin